MASRSRKSTGGQSIRGNVATLEQTEEGETRAAAIGAPLATKIKE